MVKTDAMDTVYESDEGNNMAGATIRIAKPDLVVSAVSAPETAAPGDLVTISFTVTNQGQWTAGDGAGGCQWDDALRLRPGSWFTSSCGTSPLAPGSSYTGTATVPIPTTASDEVIVAVTTDARHTVSESSEGNNGRVATIVIVRPGR